MFDSIQGRLIRSDPTRAVVAAGGIGYEIHVPLSTYEHLGSAGAEVSLLLHPVVREDDWRLFGFATDSERDVFRALLRVNGVGPAMALGLLSGLSPDEFARSVSQGDIRALTRVKGIGKKTAERIVVELRDVVAAGDGIGPSGVAAEPEAGPKADAVMALTALGLDHAEACRRVERQGDALEGAGVSEIVRAALRGKGA